MEEINRQLRIINIVFLDGQTSIKSDCTKVNTGKWVLIILMVINRTNRDRMVRGNSQDNIRMHMDSRPWDESEF